MSGLWITFALLCLAAVSLVAFGCWRIVQEGRAELKDMDGDQ